MILIADKQVLCGSCGARIGLESSMVPGHIATGVLIVKDKYVVSGDDWIFYCNQKCKEKASV
jgi:hypothetical protein